MSEYPRSEVDRAMKVQEVIMRAMSGGLQWFEAAEIIGVSCRTMRRWKGRYPAHLLQHATDPLRGLRH